MGVWEDLGRELDAWGKAERLATLWWRDDDAIAPSDALDRLNALGRAHGVVPALAVVPKTAEASLPGLALLQHGYAHTNHGVKKKAELGPDRPAASVAGELATGRRRLLDLFAGRVLPVLAPPWNRIAPEVVALLPGIGFRGLSTFKPRERAEAAPGLVQVNTHADIIDWCERRFAGDDLAVGAILGHLADRRQGRADAAEPTGVLTHHLVHDAPAWGFLEKLFKVTRAHPAIRWLTPAQAFGLAPA
ncbi:MAG: hypothetical protein FJX54_03735 [Alphaproteobacteria bacterium]|nr:hypothetical protein [Alphaproteobacteria bacterium]